MMTSLYYYDQKPSGFYFLLQIRAFVIYFVCKGKYKGKIKHISKLMASFLMFVRKKEGTGSLHF